MNKVNRSQEIHSAYNAIVSSSFKLSLPFVSTPSHPHIKFNFRLNRENVGLWGNLFPI